MKKCPKCKGEMFISNEPKVQNSESTEGKIRTFRCPECGYREIAK